MFWLVETNDQLNVLKSSSYKDAFIEVIPYSYNTHSSQNDICAVYIRPLDATKGFMLPISHSETLLLNIDKVKQVINKFDTVYVRDRKEFLNYYQIKNTFDISTPPNPPYIRELTQCHKFYYNTYQDLGDINRIIPIVKHYELCEAMFETLKWNIPKGINKFYNTKATLVFNHIERNGLKVNRDKFQTTFHNIDSDYVYTEYNFKTLTGRPSNIFRGINYGAINKKNGDREIFIPRNDKIVELDIGAYHPTLLAKLTGYTFPPGDIHESFSEMYGVDYQKAKEITFKQMYGGIWKEYRDLEFFKRAQEYIDSLWQKFQDEGFVECPISKHKFVKSEMSDMNPQKLLNYLLQNLETSFNVCIMWDIIKILKNKSTKLVLYTYDAFLFDLDKTEKNEFKQILQLFEDRGLNIKLSYGDTYNFK